MTFKSWTLSVAVMKSIKYWRKDNINRVILMRQSFL
jgi:hypothetical protein